MSGGSGGGRFRFVEGATSDLAFEASGASLGEVFHAAAEALAAATVERTDAVRPLVARKVQLKDHDLELLLLRFLNELIYLRDAQGLVLRPVRVVCREGSEIELEADLAGEPLDAARHELACDVKAATAHRLELCRVEGGWRASVTLDV
jgi:SHS2 domain-containing protein